MLSKSIFGISCFITNPGHIIGQVAHSKLITLCSRTSKCCKLWSCSFGTISFERRNKWMKFHFPPRVLVINSKNTSGEIKKKKENYINILCEDWPILNSSGNCSLSSDQNTDLNFCKSSTHKLVQNLQPKTFNTVLFTKQICVSMLFRQTAISAPLMFEAILHDLIDIRLLLNPERYSWNFGVHTLTFRICNRPFSLTSKGAGLLFGLAGALTIATL